MHLICGYLNSYKYLYYIKEKKMKKNIKLSESNIKRIIREAIENVISENENDPISRLTMLLSTFTHESLNRNYGSENDWDSITDGIVDLYEYAQAKASFDKNNIGQQYRQALSQGRDEEFYESISGDYGIELDDYLNNIDKWDKYMPTPEEVEQLSNYFIEWLEGRFEDEINDYSKIKMSEFEVCRNKLNSKIY